MLQDVQTLVELSVGDHQRHERPNHVAEGPRAHQQQAVLVGFPDHAVGAVLVGLPGPAVLDELERTHGAQAPRVPTKGKRSRKDWKRASTIWPILAAR